MNRQRALAFAAIALSLLAIWYPVLAAAAVEAPGAYDSLRSESYGGAWVTTGHGTSMESTMGPGDRALCIGGVEADGGDVVAIEFSGPDMRHRVVEKNETHIVTKGDGNDYRDPAFPRGRVKCIVVYSETAGWWP